MNHIVTIKSPPFLLAKNLLHLDKADKHSEKRARGQVRVHSPECSVGHAPLEIRCQRIAPARHRCEKHVRQFVTFQRAEKQQPHECAVLLMTQEELVTQRLQERPIVMSRCETLQFLKIRSPVLAYLLFQNCAI